MQRARVQRVVVVPRLASPLEHASHRLVAREVAARRQSAVDVTPAHLELNYLRILPARRAIVDRTAGGASSRPCSQKLLTGPPTKVCTAVTTIGSDSGWKSSEPRLPRR